MKRTLFLMSGLVTLGIALTACTQHEVILQGERLDLRAPLDGSALPDVVDTAPHPVPIQLPAQVANAEWTHRGGGVQHRLTHPALGAALAPAWVASIGEGDGRKHRITAEPVVAGGRIFTLDARATVTGFGLDGTALWHRDLTPASDSADDSSGGGLAYGGGRLFVTSGFGTLTALDPATGALIWQQRFDAPVSGAPTVEDGRVYLVAEDGSCWALDADSGRILWQLQATAGVLGMVGGPGPALSDSQVILPLPSGEVVGALKATGLKIWLTNVGGQRLGRAYALGPDITGDPVIVGNLVYVGNQTGQLVALDVNTGAQIWTVAEGTYGGVQPVGGALFAVTDAAQLVRLEAASGALVWSVALPEFTTDKVKKRKDLFANYGPLLAGGRLVLASGDGLVRFIDPASGALIGTLPLGGAAATDPVVAGHVLYLVTTDGKLHAFR